MADEEIDVLGGNEPDGNNDNTSVDTGNDMSDSDDGAGTEYSKDTHMYPWPERYV